MAAKQQSRSGKRATSRPVAPPSSARRAEILQTAARVLAARGYTNATVREIGEEVGILSGSLYYHFKSKEQMLYEILDEALTALLERYTEAADQNSDPQTTLEAFITIGLRYIEENPSSAYLLHSEFLFAQDDPMFTELAHTYSAIRDRWLAVLDAGAELNLWRSDLDREVVFRAIMGTVLSTARWYPTPHYPVKDIGIDGIVRTYLGLFVHGLARNG